MFSCGDLPSKNNEKEHMDLFSVFLQQLKPSRKPPYDFAPPPPPVSFYLSLFSHPPNVNCRKHYYKHRMSSGGDPASQKEENVPNCMSDSVLLLP
jgi:hypothetical protein